MTRPHRRREPHGSATQRRQGPAGAARSRRAPGEAAEARRADRAEQSARDAENEARAEWDRARRAGNRTTTAETRIGSEYGYALLWAALIVIFFQWAMIREVGRYTLVTGRTLLDGYQDVPGTRGWAIWLVFLPQLVAAVVTIAGIAALAGSALMIELPGAQWAYAAGLIVLSIVLVVTGRYRGVERTSAVLAGVLVLAALASAVAVFPSPTEPAAGLVPGVPEEFDLYFVLPWLGFILAGAAGILWFSYWIAARGYGEGGRDEKLSEAERIRRLKVWFRVVDWTALVGILGGGLVVVAFMILGAEVLRPEGIVPEGIAVAEDLTRLLGDVWGAACRWILLIGIFIALSGTILADQDGWGRTFADATRLLAPGRWRREGRAADDRRSPSPEEPLCGDHRDRAAVDCPHHLARAGGDPVVAGIVAAVHTPVLVFLTLYLNSIQLPRDLQAGRFMFWATMAAGLFFLGFVIL